MVKTKGGRLMNPADAFRKEQRKKEVGRNKLERKYMRDAASKRDNPDDIRKELQEVIQVEEAEGVLSKPLKLRKKALQEAYDAALKKRKEEDMRKKADLSAPEESSRYFHPVLNPSGAPPPGKVAASVIAAPMAAPIATPAAAAAAWAASIPVPKPPPLPSGPAPLRPLPPPPAAPPLPAGPAPGHAAAPAPSSAAQPAAASAALLPPPPGPPPSLMLPPPSGPPPSLRLPPPPGPPPMGMRLPPPPGPPPVARPDLNEDEAAPGTSGVPRPSFLLPPPSGPPPGAQVLPPPAGPPPMMMMLPPPAGPPPGALRLPPPAGPPPSMYGAYSASQQAPSVLPPPAGPPPAAAVAAAAAAAATAAAAAPAAAGAASAKGSTITATSTVVKRPLAQNDKTVTSMVPASVRVRREEAGPAKASKTATREPLVGPGFGLAPVHKPAPPIATPSAAAALPSRAAFPAAGGAAARPGPSTDQKYLDFMKQMEELGAFEVDAS